MKKIIVFTKKSSLNTAFDDFADERADIKILDGTNATKLLFNEDDSLFKPVSDLLQDGLYFVYDLISESDFNSLVKDFDKSELYILKHSKPEFSLTNFPNIEKGITEQKSKGGLHYPTLIEILCDTQKEKVKRIFEAVFTFDPDVEAKTDDIFNSIYSQSSQEQIEASLKSRDEIVKNKKRK